MIRIDLHTHSIASKDGSISLDQYRSKITGKELDYIAVTDHNAIDFAIEANKKIGEKIIIGEEIMTKSGEIIGLYLIKLVPANLPLAKTIELIKDQGGLVYIPHPFEKVRSGVSQEELEKFASQIDIVETVNGRAFIGNKSDRAKSFASRHNLPAAVSSDSHGLHGWGQTYSVLSQMPNKENLPALLREAELSYKKPTIRAILYPKYNKLRKALS